MIGINKLWNLINRGKFLWMLSLSLVIIQSTIASPARGQEISISFKNELLSLAFKKIEKKISYTFAYEKKDVADKTVSLSFQKRTLEEVLREFSLQTCLDFKIVGEVIAVKSIAASRALRQPPAANEAVEMSQTFVTGTVKSTDGSPLAGATVTVKGKKGTAATDQQGQFKIGATIGDVLLVSFVGYANKEVPVEDLSPISVQLETDDQSLEEVVVVGYGTVKKSDLTGSISTISSDKIAQSKGASTLAQALQGQAAGVQVTQSSGQPGEAMNIKIRGTNSLGASNAPLYVVDGIPLDGLSSQLNMGDVANVSILKDASATAIYGSRGANGVIMITTKKGMVGTPKVTYSMYMGNQNLRKKLELIDASQFAELQNEVVSNDNASGVNDQPLPLPWSPEQIAALGKGTDWQDLVYQNALMQNHDLSIAGGTENTKYYSSFGYFNQNGIIRNSGFDRLSFRVNLDQKLADKLNFTTNLSVQNSKYNRANYQSADGDGAIPFTTMVMPPTQGVYNADGSYTRFTGVSWGQTNPVGLSENWYNPNNSLRLLGNVAVNYQLLPDLKLKLTAGIDNSYDKTDLYYPSTVTLGQGTSEDGDPIYGMASKSASNSVSFINENTLEYDKSLNEHHVNVVAGISYQTTKSDDLLSGSASGFASDIYQDNNIQSAITKGLPQSHYENNRLLSYFGRANYNYASKYYLTLTGRYDGSSRFGADHKYAFFPSGAIAWALTEEDFLKDNPSLSTLKLKASYGIAGNQAIANYQTLANLSNVDVVFNNTYNTGFVLSALANDNLKWETTKQLDLGAEIGLFDDKFMINASYYNKITDDLLLAINLPGSSGFTSVLQNVGSVRNRGIEFQVSGLLKLGDVNWSPSLNISHNKTKVLDLGKDAYGQPVLNKEIGTGGNWFPTIVGQSMMQLYGYTVEGIYQTDAEAVANGEPDKKAGDYRFKNWDGQGVVNDQDDRTVLSHFEPKFTFGFSNNFNYGSFDFSFLLVGSYGNDIANEFRKYNLTMNGDWTPTKEFFDQRWMGERKGNTIDKPSSNSGSAIRDYANSLWLENGSYLRLRDVTLGYTFKPVLFKKGGDSPIRIFISLQNFLTVTKYSGYDPEVSWASASVVGWDRGNYPSTKSVTAGLTINF